MGYWNTANTGNYPPADIKKRDTALCNDKYLQTVGYTCDSYSQCANASQNGFTYRWDRLTRTPLMDFGASDSVFSNADLVAFPDLQIFPSVAGSVVPVYNIPELANVADPIVFSRPSIVGIYAGTIKSWNHPLILEDNRLHNLPVYYALRNMTGSPPINIVVRQDSSGTTSIFSGALGGMDPTFKSLQNAKAAFGTQTPYWCGGTKTDELQTVTISGCATSPGSIAMNVFRYDGLVVFPLGTFNCVDFATVFASVMNMTQYMVSTDPASTPDKLIYSIGYTNAVTGAGTNTWSPYVYSTSPGITVTIDTIQEGGYTNAPYATKALVPEIQSVFIDTAWAADGINSKTFTLTNPNGAGVLATTASASIDASLNPDLSATITAALNNVVPGAITGTKKISGGIGSVQYQITFNTTVRMKELLVTTTDAAAASKVSVGKLSNGNNYPLFYLAAQGLKNSGRYGCYRRIDNFTRWDIFTGYGNPGVIAAVLSLPYSIGYVDLEIAVRVSLPRASMINQAHALVTANSSSTAVAAMDAINFNSDQAATTIYIADSSSVGAWPMAGFTYFLLRKSVHFGGCTERKAALNFLYNFYTSSAVALVATAQGFAPLPSQLKSLVLAQLISKITCSSDGSLALAEYYAPPIPLLATSLASNALNNYLPAYDNVLTGINWNISYSDDSHLVWKQFTAAPDTVVGSFTMLASKQDKTATYGQVDDP
jgi:ABC-type phosphate transport system substrate-binding protein